MPDKEQNFTPELDAPGAGLPHIHEWLLRHGIFPILRRVMSWEQALSKYDTEGEAALAIIKSVPAEFRNKRVLIPRMVGIEDSSRFWSLNMALDHMIIVSRGAAELMARLNAGNQIDSVVDTANVKPSIIQNEDIEVRYARFLTKFTPQLKATIAEANSSRCHVHPWFGCLNIHGWAVMLAVHQWIHRRQMQEISNYLARSVHASESLSDE